MVEKRTIVELPWPRALATGGATRGSVPFSRLLWLMAAAAVLLIVVLGSIAGYLQKWLWMRQLDYAGVFWTLLSVQWAMSCSAFVFASLFLWINLRQAVKNSAALRGGARAGSSGPWSGANTVAQAGVDLSLQLLKPAAVAISAGVGLLFALGFFGQWDAYLRFRYGGSFGVSDPQFGVDVGFYVFRLPFYELLQTSLMLLAALSLAIVAAVYLGFGLIQVNSDSEFRLNRAVASHLSALLFVVAADWGFGFYLDHYKLVYSTLGVVFGAGYAADHVTRIALWAMVALSAAACALLALNVFRPRSGPLFVGTGIYLGCYLVGVYLLPDIFQKFYVQPSELALETPYLKNYIEFTREAYGLDAIRETSYPALSDLTPAVLARNQDTIRNIRLWDSRPLLQTYQQTQAIRLYYQFYHVGVDRYHLADGYHQVMVAARELSPELPAQAQTWVNRYLQFTHGYGLVMSFVSKATEGGFPQYLLENVPAQPAFGLTITQPSIYFGESMPGYRIVATGVKEFDYPRGNDNVYSSYAGKGGITLDSLWKKLLFAWTQSDVNILLTSYLRVRSTTSCGIT